MKVSNHIHESSSQSRSHGYKSGAGTRKGRTTKGEIRLYSINNIETRVDANGQVSSSQERIIDGKNSRAGTREGEENVIGNGVGISKTVEFEFHESAA